MFHRRTPPVALALAAMLALTLSLAAPAPAGTVTGRSDLETHVDSAAVTPSTDADAACATTPAGDNPDAPLEGRINAPGLSAISASHLQGVSGCDAVSTPAPTATPTAAPPQPPSAAPPQPPTAAPRAKPRSAPRAEPPAAAIVRPTATPDTLPGTRDKTLWPFAQDSIWNMPIGSGAVYVPAGIAARELMAVDDEYIVVTSPSDPVVPFYTNAVWGSGRCATMTYEYSLNVPANLVIGDASDSSTPNSAAAFVAADGRTIHQMNPVARCDAGGPLTAGWTAPDQDIYGDGALGSHGGSGLSSIGGSLRLGELTGPAPIRHALKVNLWGHEYLSPDDGGYRWPAVTADSYAEEDSNRNHYGGAVPQLRMGALLAIPPTVNINSLGLRTTAAKKLAWTLQNYGAYVVDDTTADSHALDVQAGVAAQFEAAFGTPMEATGGPWYDDMMTLFAALNVVDNNGPTSIGGGGVPLQPLAPPIGN